MRIDIRGRNVEVTDELREQVDQRFNRIGRQLSPLARVEVVLSEQRNPAITDKFVAEATVHVKGITLHAHEASPEMLNTIHALAENLNRQVKRYREKRRKRSRTRHLVNKMQGRPSEGTSPSV